MAVGVIVGLVVGVALAVAVGVEVPQRSTLTGLELLVVVPFPNWPEAFAPQHFTLQSLVSAQLNSYPAAMSTTEEPTPVTVTGDHLSVVVPSPT